MGFSMGAQQAFHWGALHGDKTGGIVPLLGTAKTTTQNWISLEGCKLALQADVNYNNGDYTSPPKKGLEAFSRNYTSTLFDKDKSTKGPFFNDLGILFFTSSSYNQVICPLIFSCFISFSWNSPRGRWMSSA